jgi:hypothetical protein
VGAVTGRFASRRAEELAVELGLADVAIVGTGRGGKATARDVRAAAPSPAERREPARPFGPAGLVLFEALHKDYDFRPDEDPIVTAACRTQDELDVIEQSLAAASPTVTGSRANVRPHPLLEAARAHRVVLARLLAQLGIADAHARGGTDDRQAALERQTAGRRLARARWANRG